jgi:hypothetical protein
MMQDLIGLDGRPLQLCGLALPYNEGAANKPAIAPGALNWNEDVPIVWGHDAGHVIASGWRVELIETYKALFFAATLPATAAAQHVANVASFGSLRVSIETNDFGAEMKGEIITRTRLSHIGLTTTPAHPETIVWRGDFERDSLTGEQRGARNRFNVAAMAYRASFYTPTPPPSAEVFAFTKNLVHDLNASAKARKIERQREFEAADRIIDEANEMIEGRRMLQAALGRQSAGARRGVRPGFLPRPGRRPPCPVSGVKRTSPRDRAHVRK